MSRFRRLQSIRDGAARLSARLQCIPLLVVTAACLVVEEQYPLSNFPMYSSFSPSTYYVYLADGAAQPLPSFSTIGNSTATLKKIYHSELRREARRLGSSVGKLTDDNKRACGERVLAGFRKAAAAGRIGGLPEVLRLYEVQIRLQDEQLSKETKLVAELR